MTLNLQNTTLQADVIKLQTALSLHQQGELDQAETLYREILEFQPQHFDALQLLATLALQQGNTIGALELFELALQINPYHPGTLNNIGIALLELKRTEQALDYFDRALALQPDYAEALNNSGFALLELNQAEQALQRLELALALQPDDAEVLNNRGKALFDLKRLEQARDSFELAIVLQPDFAEALKNSGVALLELSQLELAQERLELAITLKPDYAEALNKRGIVLFHLKRLELARDSFDLVIALEPDNAEALKNSGVALLELNQYEEALERFERVLTLQPDDAEALNNRGKALFHLKHYEQAVDSFNQILTIFPNHTNALIARGVGLLSLERFDQALDSFDRAIALQPNDAETLNNRGIAWLHLKRPELALDNFKRAITVQPGYKLALKNKDTALNDLNNQGSNNYHKWIADYDTVTLKIRSMMQEQCKQFASSPLISVVMPVYNSNPVWLVAAIESVLKQIYTNWELCIADDFSSDVSIRPILERYVNQDKRIKIVFRQENGHISKATNSALEVAKGEWIALLDHDDLLSEHALFWTADAINKNPDIRMIYSDMDKITEQGVRYAPYFKCDWNQDLFYSHNMFCHLSVYHADLIRKVEGFRIGFDGAQGYDLALRCIEHIASVQIYHIPRVLYHWRVHEQSTSYSVDAKPYVMISAEKALNEHLKRQDINAKANKVGIYEYRVRYALPDILPLVSLIIPTRNGLQLLQQCIESIVQKTTYPNYEILIIDNGSDELETLEYFKVLTTDSRIRVIRDDSPFNYSALNNAAVKLSRGELIGLINNDIEVISPDWLSEMVSHALRPEVGAVGAKLLYLNSTIQNAGDILGIGIGHIAGHAHKDLPRDEHGYFGRANLIQSFSAVTAACLVIRKATYESLGGLNEVDLQVVYNDVDFCIRLRNAGYRNIWTPYAELYHHESATRGYEDTPEKKARFKREITYMQSQWGDALQNDPAYSPNLTLHKGDFSLAWPPRLESKH